jgi:uncharacterized coiled-coil protein SlyX
MYGIILEGSSTKVGFCYVDKERWISMPTQEERLMALEQQFATQERDVKQAIQDLNANSTIMLGLIYKLGQENRQMVLSMDLLQRRMDDLEARFDAHTVLLNEHTRVLGEHTARLDRIEVRLDRIETRLDEHTKRFDNIDTVLAQILTRLPER